MQMKFYFTLPFRSLKVNLYTGKYGNTIQFDVYAVKCTHFYKLLTAKAKLPNKS